MKMSCADVRCILFKDKFKCDDSDGGLQGRTQARSCLVSPVEFKSLLVP